MSPESGVAAPQNIWRAADKQPARHRSIARSSRKRRRRFIDRFAEFSDAFGEDADSHALSFFTVDLVLTDGYEF